MMPPFAMPASSEPPPEEGDRSIAGAPLDPSVAKPADRDAVIAALQTVYDPEIPINIYELGLIYDIGLKDNGDVDVLMTLTAPACPVAGEMPGQVADTVAAVEGVGLVTVTMTWDPPWTPEKMSEAAQVALDMY